MTQHISINDDEPIHVSFAAEEYQKLRRTHATKIITIQQSKRNPTKPPNYEESWAKFDQMRPVIASNTTQATDTTTIPPIHQTDLDKNAPKTPAVAILTHSSTKLVAYKNIMDYFRPQNPHSAQWRYTAFQQ